LPSDSGQSFAPCRRIRRRCEFDSVFRASRQTGDWFTVHVRKNELGYARLGIIASKKIMPRAVSRNYAKRLIRDAFRRNFPAELSLDIVVSARRAVGRENSGQIRTALMRLFSRVAA
jgi:ribonuclease P protein component